MTDEQRDPSLTYLRAEGGEVVGYRKEEIGMGRSGPGPVIRTVRGMYVWIAVLVFAFAYFVSRMFMAAATDPEFPFWMWLFPFLWAGLIAFNIRPLIKEFRAAKLREERGLPTPVE